MIPQAPCCITQVHSKPHMQIHHFLNQADLNTAVAFAQAVGQYQTRNQCVNVTLPSLEYVTIGACPLHVMTCPDADTADADHGGKRTNSRRRE